MTGLPTAGLDRFVFSAEKRIHPAIIAIVAGFGLLAFAALLCTPRFDLRYHGLGMTRLSLHPFDLENENDLRFRILSPLTAYLLFFRGAAFKYFMLLVLGSFYSAAYALHRRDGYSPSESLLITALLCFSTLSFHQYFFPGYPDPTSFLLLLLFIFNYKKEWAAWLCLLLLFFNHDYAFFLLPFCSLLLIREDHSGRQLFRKSLLVLLALGPYLLYRFLIDRYSVVEFNTGYYFDAHNMEWTREHVAPHLLSGIFQAFKLTWIFPLIAMVAEVRERRWKELLLLLSCVVPVTSQMFIAYDISRLMGLAFPAILLGLWRCRELWGTKRFLSVAVAVMVLNWLVPSYYIGALDPIPYPPFWLSYF